MRHFAMLLAALGGSAIGARDSWGIVPSLQMPDGVYNLPGAGSWTPGFYAPKFNQRKARKMARRVGKAVFR